MHRSRRPEGGTRTPLQSPWNEDWNRVLAYPDALSGTVEQRPSSHRKRWSVRNEGLSGQLAAIARRVFGPALVGPFALLRGDDAGTRVDGAPGLAW